jgi:Pentapeptide repeats (8 copies)
MVLVATATSLISTGTAVVGALIAILGALGYQNRRARLSAIRTAFNDVVASLASEDSRQQLAAAVLLRRFFDEGSELAVRGILGRRRVPYAGESLSVMAAVLRGLPSGELQKLLADGLAYAPTLEGADLQRTNLQGAYLSERRTDGTLNRADFYRADISGGSLKNATAMEAVFYQARLRGTVCANADLRGANFFQSDVTGAKFHGARLKGASFAGAIGIPDEIAPLLDSESRYTSDEPAPAHMPEQSPPAAVFLSRPSHRSPAQEAVCDRLTALLVQHGLTILTLPALDYPPSDALSEIYRRLKSCAGAVVLGLRSADAATDGPTAGATPWTHVEAGLAYACELPLLIVREPGVALGAFDEAVAGHQTYILNVSDDWVDEDVLVAIRPWLAALAQA